MSNAQSDASSVGGTTSEASAWAPLKVPLFRMVWIAALASNIGTWMHDVGAGWLMTSLSPSPVMVALVQTATTLPVFLLAMPAGALSDIIDRRRYLIAVQVWMMGIALLLTWTVLAGVMTPWLLVLLTFGMGLGTAMMLPAWAAVTPEVVPKAQLSSAVALNSMGVNVARAIGPALAGVIVSFAGSGAVFALNALSYLGVIYVLYRWQREPAFSGLPAERFTGALRAGLRYARHAPNLHAAAIRGLGFFVFASASWALLPLVARQLEGGGPETFGILVASIGAGAVFGAVLLPKVREKFSRDTIVALATVAYAGAMMTLATLDQQLPLVAALFLAGAAWIAVLSSLQVAAQLSLPGWVRSRGLAVFMTVFMGSMALGSLAWGKVAEQTDIETALLMAATGALLAIALTWRWKISAAGDADLTPSMHWPTPMVHEGVSPDRGPVLINIEYRVQASQLAAFLEAIALLAEERRRDGAYRWSVFEHTEHPHSFIETFEVESWLEHLRQHERVTDADRVTQEHIQTLLEPGTQPIVNHYVAPNPKEILP